ncbi:DUF2950 domain-containing protein [uncultured Ramlibacter sp.]|uniref:DUF2950 domain-containing protein n=1 Tax=uncultured Ramlibacter sp. TaxID=260755 RepID=UPI00260FDD97|nr:DUF2950 domain-containing protein [uncultured Ramlibacter sp.]
MKTFNRFSMQARAAAFAFVALLGLPAAAQAPFETAEQAADALVAAVSSGDKSQMARVLGKDWRSLVPVEVPAADRAAFLDKAKQSRAVIAKEGKGMLVVGSDPWLLPVPLLQGKDGRWRFDTAGGHEIVQARRIGRNELSAMQAMLAYVDAQRDYAKTDRTGAGVLTYAQKLMSSPGKRDGLIWSPKLGDDSPLGESFVPKQAGEGYHGYHYRILTGQGADAKGGARSYLIGKNMVSGYALLAWPVQYGKTGVMSFIVNQEGVVYERDLGAQTTKQAGAIKVFNPDAEWKKAQF